MNRFGLRTRLFAWLIAAILAGMAASSTAWLLVRSEVDSGPLRTMSRALGAQITAEWDDPSAVDATVEHARAATGSDLKLRRDVDALPASVRAHRTSLVFDRGECFVPIIRDARVVGALEFHSELPPGRLVRLIVFLGVALIVLAIAARSISGLVVRPLERVAAAAHRVGEGELDTRAGDDPRASPEVREVAKAFDTMAARVERMVRDQRDLLAAVSHELRSPLGRARVALELARDQGANAPAMERVERSMNEVDSILGDLLSITRAGLSDLHKQPTPLVAFLRQRFTDGDGARVIVSGDESVIAPVDPALFERAVSNVIENARHHAGPGEIRVTVEPKGDRALVSVRDEGGGVPSEILEKAFDPFVKGDAARSPQNGKKGGHQSTGLGLAIVRRVVEAHGGSASIRNIEQAGKVVGAEVSIEVPAA
jgi:two-component system OmpR family sensor kinase